MGRVYEVGVENVIFGMKVFDMVFFERFIDEFGGIIVSLDVKDGRIVVKGWVEEGLIKVRDVFEIFRNYVNCFVYIFIERDGILIGVDEIGCFWGDEEFIYVGGVFSVEDIVRFVERGFFWGYCGEGFL